LNSIGLVGVGSLLIAATLELLARAGGTPTTTRVSLTSEGGEGRRPSYFPAVSADGRFVAFTSDSRLDPDDNNRHPDVLVHDREMGDTTSVSVSSRGRQGNSESLYPSISGDGTVVAFYSYASNLVPGDTNGTSDVFVHDLQTNRTTRVSVSSQGRQAKAWSGCADVSADGMFVAFGSRASNLVMNDGNRKHDVFVHSLKTGRTRLVSKSSRGRQGNGPSGCPSISAHGRIVEFGSSASNLVPEDTDESIEGGGSDIFVRDRRTLTTAMVSVTSNGEERPFNCCGDFSDDGRFIVFSSLAGYDPLDDCCDGDVFLHDLETGETERVSVGFDGTEPNEDDQSYSRPFVSRHGRFVAFSSHASNLVEGDTNGFDDVFVRDRVTGSNTRVSVASDGTEANGNSDFEYPGVALSSNGRFVAFASEASNLVENDTNSETDVFVRGPLR
jgi:Tol biopolymer transport system component